MTEADKILSAIEQVVRVLAPLESEDRHSVIHASLVVLREKAGNISSLVRSKPDEGVPAAGDVPNRARLWMRQNDLNSDQLLQVFDVSDGVATVIASEVSGKNNAEKTVKAYVLTGLAALLASGEANFDDKAARALCESLGCYDSSNHTKYLKEKGNNFTGSKAGGWKLTAPGLKFGAVVIKELANA
jgi:hypothetical protein